MKAFNILTVGLLFLFNQFSITAQALITFPSASTTATFSDPGIQSVSTLNPNPGISAVGCGTWLSATGYSETSLADAMQYGDYWDFYVELAVDKEITINNFTLTDIGNDLAAASTSNVNFALVYKIGSSGTWLQALVFSPEKLDGNVCSGGGNSFSFNTSFSSVEDVHFRLVAWGDETVQIRFGAFILSGVIATPLPSGPEILMLKTEGKVVIGDTAVINTPGSYGLYVQDGILTESVKVALRSTSEWSDNAFYDEPSLDEVENSIKESSHLLDMPSAFQLVNEGYELKAMDAKLLAQIEWLWLKVIELDKRNTQLQLIMGKD